MKIFLIDEDEIATLRAIEQRLHAGTDRERDAGHKIWYVLNNVERHEYRDEGENT